RQPLRLLERRPRHRLRTATAGGPGGGAGSGSFGGDQDPAGAPGEVDGGGPGGDQAVGRLGGGPRHGRRRRRPSAVPGGVSVETAGQGDAVGAGGPERRRPPHRQRGDRPAEAVDRPAAAALASAG